MALRLLPFSVHAIDGTTATPMPAEVGAGLAALLGRHLEAVGARADLEVSGVLWLSDRWQAELRLEGAQTLRRQEEAPFDRAHHLLYRLFALVAEAAGAAIPEPVTLAFDDYATAVPGALLEYLRGLGSETPPARRAAWGRAFELDPALVATRLALAGALADAGDAAAAAALVAGCAVHDAAAAADLGLSLWSAGEADAAAQLLAAAVSADANHALAHAALASLLARRGSADEALYLATRATQLQSDDYRTWTALAEVHRAGGDFAQACFYYGFALRLAPPPRC